MRPLPIRIRLTLLYFIFFAAAGLLLSAASWLVLRHSLTSTAQHELEERADDVQAFLNAQSPELSTQQLRDALIREYSGQDEGKYLQVIDDQGTLLYFSERKSHNSRLGSFPGKTSTPLPFHDRPGGLQVYVRAMLVHGRAYQVANAMAMKRSNALLWSFFVSLLILTPALLAMAAFVGHMISRKALAPVAAMTAAAREITDKNLSRRLPSANTRDEMSDLSTTLNLMLARIDGAFNSVRAFTANASHEMRTPLALVRTRVDIALCFPRTAEQYRTTLLEVQASAEHMTATLDSLLRLARADAGVEILQLKPVELNALLRQVSEDWQDTALRSQLRFTAQVSEQPVWVAGETTSLRRLLHILIDNAFRYTPAGGAVDLKLTSSEYTASFSVADTGSGISPKDLPHIFERFYRSEQSGAAARASGRKTGAGLGLSLSRWIAEQHGAELNVESTEEGSTFRFVIPRTRCLLPSVRTSATMIAAIPPPNLSATQSRRKAQVPHLPS